MPPKHKRKKARLPGKRHSDGKDLEKKTLEVLRAMGLDMRQNVRVGQCQIDLHGIFIVGNSVYSMIVECKDYGDRQNVGIAELKEFGGAFSAARKVRKADRALFVTTLGFTADARAYAEIEGIQLATYKELATTFLNFDAYTLQITQSFEQTPCANFIIRQGGAKTEDGENHKDASFFSPLDTLIQDSWNNKACRKLALLGNFGTGKSTFLRYLTYVLAKIHTQDKTSPIPIFVSLRNYDCNFDIHTLVRNCLQQDYGFSLTPAAWQVLWGLGKFIFLFDGLEEMTTKGDQATIRNNLGELDKVLETPGNKLIVSCRTHFFRSSVQKKSCIDFDTFYLAEWGEREIDLYLKKRFKDQPLAIGRIRQLIRTHKLTDLAKTPYFMDLITTALSEQGNSLTRTGLYRIFAETLIREQSERTTALLTYEEKIEFLKCISLKICDKEPSSLHYKEFPLIIKKYLLKLDESKRRFNPTDAIRIDALNRDLQTNSFLVRDQTGNYFFRHSSFKEFFIALAIKEDFLNCECKYQLTDLLPPEINLFLDQLRDDSLPHRW